MTESRQPPDTDEPAAEAGPDADGQPARDVAHLDDHADDLIPDRDNLLRPPFLRVGPSCITG